MGRAFARKFGVDGELPDFELAWLRHKQHELATRGGSRLKRGRFSLRRVGSARGRMAGADPEVLPGARLGTAGRPAPSGGRSWTLVRRMPKRGTTGVQPSAGLTYVRWQTVARETGQWRAKATAHAGKRGFPKFLEPAAKRMGVKEARTRRDSR
jgi:hypothetical protein